MSHKFGFPSMTKRAMGNKSSSNASSKSSKGKILCRVIDIILDENHPNFNPQLGYSQIGTITAEYSSVNSTISPKVYIASPSNSNFKQLPLINEYVYVSQLPAPNYPSGKWVYDPQPVSLYNGLSPNSSPFPNPTTSQSPPESTPSYNEVSEGAFVIKELNSQPLEISLNSPVNPSQNTFIEKNNIFPLMPFAGDILHEGRWGNSIRFGGTAKSQSTLLNFYSSDGENGDPIIILRNGQNPDITGIGNTPVIEDINKDQSSIYLTSTQTISNFIPSSNNYSSFSSPPLLPSAYKFPQIILNSDQIFISSKTDNILLNSKKSISLSSLISSNIDSPTTIIKSNNIFLGDRNAVERGVKGDTLYNKLDVILQSLITLVKVLEVQQVWPGGLPSPDGGTMMISSITKNQLENELKSLSDILSKCVKTL